MRRQTKYIVIHCSATKRDDDIGFAEIDQWHKNRGWDGCGYHLIIRRDGSYEPGREIQETGAHVRGYNQVSVGICLIGGVDVSGNPQSNYTPQQFSALRDAVLVLQGLYPRAVCVGHRDLIKPGEPQKACPCFDVPHWYEEIFG